MEHTAPLKIFAFFTFVVLLFCDSIHGWSKTSFFINSKLPAQCGQVRAYSPDNSLEQWGVWPWLAYVLYDGVGNSKINAILIHPQVVITGLFHIKHAPEVILKDHLFVAFSTPGLPSFQNISGVELDSLGPNYNSPTLALIRLQRPVVVSSHVHPVCLWEQHDDWDSQISGQTGMMIGTDFNHIWSSKDLRIHQAPARIYSTSKCATLTKPGLYDKKFICYRYIREPKTCHIGGSALLLPRLAEDGTLVWYLRGVTAHQLWFCAQDDNYVTVHDVAASRAWIESHFRASTEAGCGRRVLSHTPLITRGTEAQRGDWPWHAALYRREKQQDFSYHCGGSLIAEDVVLTAGHCVVSQDQVLRPEELQVRLGKHRLSQQEDGSLTAAVSSVVLHNNYNSSNLRNDIAILRLAARVKYSEFIQPVCLWDETDTSKTNIYHKVGTAVGWGFREDNKVSDVLTVASIPVVEDIYCYQANANFYATFLTDLTFCAGNPRGNGTNVCNGDSGGGLVLGVTQADGQVSWFLRGLVSLSVSRPDQRVCDPDYYAIYTDVAKYSAWLADNLAAGNSKEADVGDSLLDQRPLA